jgi:hypothetical protein
MDVQVLQPSAHVALQAVHLGAGHRYAKLVLYRDIDMQLGEIDVASIKGLGIGRYLDNVRAVLGHLGVRAPHPSENSLSRSLTARDPASWNEFRVTVPNLLAAVDGLRPGQVARLAGTALRTAVKPRRDRRAGVAFLREPRTHVR